MTTTIILLCIGLAAGILSGLVGIGGGIIIVPALAFFVGMTQHQAQGTSIAALILPVGALAVVKYYQAGMVDIRAALIIASTFLIGGFIGAKLSIALDENIIKKIFGFLLLTVAVKMIFFK